MMNEYIKRFVKYILEGLAVAIAAHYIPNQKMKPMDVLAIALTSAATFAVLDTFTPEIAAGARQGTGFGIGLGTAGISI